MNPDLKVKIIQFVIVIINLVIGIWLFQRINPDAFFNAEGAPVSLTDIAGSPGEVFAGRSAGEDISRLSGSSDYQENKNKYMTAEPLSIIPTGIYAIKPWVNPYEITKGQTTNGRLYRTGRKAPEVTDSQALALEYYQEYYLIELPDHSFVLAQFSDRYYQVAKKGGVVTLPIGIKKGNSSTAKQYLKEICSRYEVSNIETLYMINDQWYQDHDFMLFIIKFAIAASVFMILSVSGFLMLNKFIE